MRISTANSRPSKPRPKPTLIFPGLPIKGRHVATLGALRARYAPRLQQSRDGFITDLIHRGDRTPAGRGSLPVPLR